MPPRVQSHASALAQFRGIESPSSAKDSGAKGPSAKEQEQAAMFRRLQDVVNYLDANGHGGKIIVPLPPNRTNAASGQGMWFIEDALKRAYKNHLDELLLRRLIPKPPQEPPAFARVVTTVYVAQLHDVDNLQARTKWPVDWLKGNGYLFDDSPKYSERLQPVQQKVPRHLVRIEFEIEPVEIT